MESFLDEKKCPLNKQIDNIDDTIKELNERIGKIAKKTGLSYIISCFDSEKLQKKIGYLDPESVQRKALTQELVEIRKLVNTHETNLKALRRHNKKSFIFCALIIFLVFLLYAIYVLIYGY